ncbi:hypothetical protein [Halorientalis salina]|uniref:hypothetical protein n=1 Tax=Halorientalis salina TaxID=2932266 RepID=UPI00145D776C|nr:hypothetical protein [Halorientalis salina]
MEWRCAWCGKPHEENDPPCDNCGHGEFEKAVVPMAPEAEDDDSDTMTVWVCSECGNDHPKHTPPCDRCGGGPLEKREVEFDQDQVMAEMLGDGDAEASDYSPDIGYLDVLDAKLVVAFLAVGALVVVLGLGFAGIVNVPFLPNSGPVPGNATAVDGLSLSTVETEYVTELNDRRAAGGADTLSRDEDLASAATWVNEQRVRRDYADGDGPSSGELRDRVSDACRESELSPVIFRTSQSVGQDAGENFENETGMARALVDAYRTNPDAPESFADASNGLVGVDVHAAPDGRIYVTQLAC